MTTENRTGERIAVVEQQIIGIKNKVEKLEGNNDVLVRLGTLMEVQTEMNQQQNVQMEKFSNVLDSVDRNLSNLNNSHEQLKTDMDSIGSKVKHIEKAQADNKIDPVKLVRNIIIGLIMLTVTVAGAWLLKATGLK